MKRILVSFRLILVFKAVMTEGAVVLFLVLMMAGEIQVSVAHTKRAKKYSPKLLQRIKLLGLFRTA